MPCTNSDGALTAAAQAILKALQKDATAEQVASEAELPLFRVRSALRDLSEMGLVVVADGRAALTEEGRKRV